MTTFRKVPEDLEQVKFIRGLIDAHIDTHGSQLASEKKWAELNKLTTWQTTWAEIEADLSKPEEKAERAPKAVTNKPAKER